MMTLKNGTLGKIPIISKRIFNRIEDIKIKIESMKKENMRIEVTKIIRIRVVEDTKEDTMTKEIIGIKEIMESLEIIDLIGTKGKIVIIGIMEMI